MDYQSGGYLATFCAGQTTATVAIHITDDHNIELTEDFSAVLAFSALGFSLGVSAGAADTASIDIMDNDDDVLVNGHFIDPVGVLFSPTHYSVNESDGVVQLTLIANGSSLYDYSVKVDTANGVAVGQLLYMWWSKYSHLLVHISCLYFTLVS